MTCTVCILHPHSSAYSETFIHAHLQYLPGVIKSVHYGSWNCPIFQHEGRSLVSTQPISRFTRWMQRQVLGRSPQTLQTDALAHFLKAHQVDVVLAEYGPSGILTMPACILANIPLVVHFHGMDAYAQSVLDPFADAYQVLFQKADALVAVSHAMKQQLLGLGAPPERVFYNPYGVDTTEFKATDPAMNPPTFVAVGRFVDKKAPHLTLLAFHQVIRQCPEARLIMLGEGPLWEACKQLAVSLGIEQAVEFPGICPPAVVATTLAGARAFVQHSIRTSYGDSEGTPVAILEAGATGLPVVATRHAGIPDVVLHETTGFLVEEHDIEGMAHYMVQLAQNPALAAQLGQVGRQRIEAAFSLHPRIQALWKILESILR